MSTSDNVEQIKQKITELIRHAAEARIRDHSREDDFALTELNRTPGQVLGNWMSIILVTGEAVRITIKLHFSNEQAKAISHNVYGVSSANEVSDIKATDFVKELCNLTAGYLVQIFEEMSIPLGISLPLCTRGFYEVFADYSPTTSPLIRYSDLWRLEHQDQHINGSVMIEITNASALAALADFELSQDDSDDDSEFDFL